MENLSQFHVGSKIRFTTKDGEFEGTIKSVFYGKKHIKLDCVKSLLDHKDLEKMSVFSYEIIAFKELECRCLDAHKRENAENTVFDKVNVPSELTDSVSPSNDSKLSSETIKENFVAECRSRLEKLNLKKPVKSDGSKTASQSERKIRFVPAGMDC